MSSCEPYIGAAWVSGPQDDSHIAPQRGVCVCVCSGARKNTGKGGPERERNYPLFLQTRRPAAGLPCHVGTSRALCSSLEKRGGGHGSVAPSRSGGCTCTQGGEGCLRADGKRPGQRARARAARAPKRSRRSCLAFLRASTSRRPARVLALCGVGRFLASCALLLFFPCT